MELDGQQLDDSFSRLIFEARQGAGIAFDRLLEPYWNYLLLTANQELHQAIRGKVGASEIVQQTLMEAVNRFDHFRGTTRAEFAAWLRGILLNNLRDVARRYVGTEKRQVAREVSLDGELNVADLRRLVTADEHSPGSHAAAKEDAQRLRKALERLPDDYRQAIVLRQWNDCTFAEIGARLNRTEEAARKLWARAIERLKIELGEGELR